MEKQQQFKALCDILQLILDSYQHHEYLPDWLFQPWHPRIKQIKTLKNKINAINNATDFIDSIDAKETALINLLDAQRYLLSTHTSSHRFRSKIQDALLETLFFQSEHIKQYQKMVLEKSNPAEFLKYLERTEAIEQYKLYYKKQHTVHGRFADWYTDNEILLLAKANMINGKLIERFGIKTTIAHGLNYIRKELKNIQKQQNYSAYLTQQTVNGYLEKLDFLLHPANEIQQNEFALIQNARYLLEDIVNATSSTEANKARDKTHQPLVLGCYWVEEMFKVARGRVEAEDII